MWYVSRAYVPYAFYRMYKKGTFEEYFTFVEVKAVIKVAIMMYLISLTGHAMMRYMTRDVVDKYIGEN